MYWNWKGFKWDEWYHTKWDIVNEDDLYATSYFGEDGVRINDDGNLEFFIVNNPKYWSKDAYSPVTKETDGSVCKNNCCGEVMSNESFSYGTYTWKVHIPNTRFIWPAIWLTGANGWPPEIDVFEMFGDGHCTHYRNIFNTKIETNIHYNNSKGKKACIAGKPILSLMWKLFHKDIDEFKLIWNKKYVKIYWNGFLIRCVRNRGVINFLNENNKMTVVMNTMTRPGFEDSDQISTQQDPMVVYDFKYTPF